MKNASACDHAHGFILELEGKSVTTIDYPAEVPYPCNTITDYYGDELVVLHRHMVWTLARLLYWSIQCRVFIVVVISHRGHCLIQSWHRQVPRVVLEGPKAPSRGPKGSLSPPQVLERGAHRALNF